MTITCPKCKTRLTLPDEKLKPEGTKFKCSKCGTSLFYKGKGRKAPEDDTPETKAPSPFSSAEGPAALPSQVLSNPGEQPVLQSGPSPDPADSGGIPQAGAAVESPATDERQKRPKKTEVAGETVQQYSSPVSEGPANLGAKGEHRKAVMTGAAAGFLILVLVGVFFFHSQDRMYAPGADKGATTPPPSTKGKGTVSPGDSPGSSTAGLPQGGNPAEQSPGGNAISATTPSAITEEKAIEIVQRSDALLKRTSVESIVRIWTEKNAAKYKVVGWQARKMDEQKYLVSYTALDSDMPKGFYFELDAQTGAVQDLAQNQELQKKYNIQYNK